jgi:hypothetical protein
MTKIINTKIIEEINAALTAIVEHGVTTHRQGAIEYAKTLKTGDQDIRIKDYPTAIAVLKEFGNNSRECRFYLSMDELAWMKKAYVPSKEFAGTITKAHIAKNVTVKKMISVQSMSYTELVLAWHKGEKSFRLYNHDTTRKTFNSLTDLWIAKCCIALKNWKTGNTSAIGNWVSSLELAMKPFLKFTIEGESRTNPADSTAIFTCHGTFDDPNWTSTAEATDPLIQVPVKPFLLEGWEEVGQKVEKMVRADQYIRPKSDKLQRGKGVGQIKADAAVDITKIMDLPSDKVKKMIRWGYTFTKEDENKETFMAHYGAKEAEVKVAHEKKLAEAKEAKSKKVGAK